MAATDPAGALARLSALYLPSGAHHYGGAQAGADLKTAAGTTDDGPLGVSFLAHALQCAAAARAAHPGDDELVAAALLHDVGWLLPRPAAGELLTTAAPGTTGTAEAVFIARHDATGSAFLASLGFPARVCELVAGHVQAKRYLVATEPGYTLSPGSTWTLAQQGGPMSPAEAAAFAASPDAQLCLALRRWDEAAKVPGLQVPGWEAHAAALSRVLHAARWAPLDSPALPPSLRLAAVAPTAAASPLGPAGPGYVVIRGWLSAEELAALRAYADAIPTFPPSEVHHTFESNGDGQVVPSRTEHFAHLPHASGGGAFLLDGRLRALCSALREGRAMELYKEKINYKLKGSTGGYTAHVDFYHKINPSTLEREALLDDADVCVCMLAIDAMDEGNGCPFVAPGWHTRGPMAFRQSADVYKSHTRAPLPVFDADELPWQPVTLAAGDVLIYGNSMPHYSKANTSERDRRALFAVYADARHGPQRAPYYAYEARGRRANGSGSEQGKANGFFTGKPVHVAAA